MDIPKGAGLLKQTLIPSPITKHLFNMRVCVKRNLDTYSKKPNKSNNNKTQVLRNGAWVEILSGTDSQDLFDDEFDQYLFPESQRQRKRLEPPTDPDSADYMEIPVMVKLTSLMVEGNETLLPASVRCACLVPGIKMTNSLHEEDSLLVILSSGYLLLIRIVFDDIEFASPVVVQWWNLNYSDFNPRLLDLGSNVQAHASGYAIAITASMDLIRLHNCLHTYTGIYLDRPFNLRIDGTIIDSVFVDPFPGDSCHVMFLTLVVTREKRLVLNLFEWFTNEPIGSRLKEHTLPLPNTFEIPIFIVSMGTSFLFVSDKAITVVKLHDIMSADYSFVTTPISCSFPVSFYKPKTEIYLQKNEEEEEENEEDIIIPRKRQEVIICTQSGVLYSVILEEQHSHIDFKPILRMSDVPTVFFIEKNPITDTFIMKYSDDQGNAKHITFRKLISNSTSLAVESKLNYTHSRLIESFENWTPLFDFKVISTTRQRNVTNHSSEEIWTLSGSGRKSSLVHLRSGIKTSRLFRDSEFKSALNMFSVISENTIYLIISYAFHSQLIEYNPLASDPSDRFALVEESPIELDSRTVLAGTISNNVVQITDSSITVISSMLEVEPPFQLEFDSSEIILADILHDLVCIITDSCDSEPKKVINLYQLIVINDEEIPSLQLVLEQQLLMEPTVVKLVQINEINYIMMGSYEGELLIYKIGDSKLVPVESTGLSEIFINDVYFHNEGNTLLLGTRDGCVGNYEVEIKDERIILHNRSFTRISETPIDFSAIPDSCHTILIISRTVWKLDLRRSNYPAKLLLDPRAEKATQFALQLPDELLVALREDGFCLYTSITRSVASCVPRTIRLGEQGKKFLYISHFGLFSVITGAINPLNRLVFIDKKRLRILPSKQVRSSSDFSEVTDPYFAPDEIPISMAEWIVIGESKTYKHLLIGYQKGPGQGGVKIFYLSKIINNKNEIEGVCISQLNSWKTEGPVFSIKQLGDNSMVYGCANRLLLRTYDLEARKLFPSKEIYSFPSNVNSITVKEDHIYVSTSKDSVYHFVYQDDGLRLVHNDIVSRFLLNEVICQDLIVVGDRYHSTISGLLTPNGEQSLTNVFRSHLPFIPRLANCDLSSIWSQQPTDHQRIVACGVNGEVICFTLLNSRELDQLRTVSAGAQDYGLSEHLSGTGLYSLNQLQWSQNWFDENIIDGDRLEGVPGELEQALHGVSL